MQKNPVLRKIQEANANNWIIFHIHIASKILLAHRYDCEFSSIFQYIVIVHISRSSRDDKVFLLTHTIVLTQLTTQNISSIPVP